MLFGIHYLHMISIRCLYLSRLLSVKIVLVQRTHGRVLYSYNRRADLRWPRQLTLVGEIKLKANLKSGFDILAKVQHSSTTIN